MVPETFVAYLSGFRVIKVALVDDEKCPLTIAFNASCVNVSLFHGHQSALIAFVLHSHCARDVHFHIAPFFARSRDHYRHALVIYGLTSQLTHHTLDSRAHSAVSSSLSSLYGTLVRDE